MSEDAHTPGEMHGSRLGDPADVKPPIVVDGHTLPTTGAALLRYAIVAGLTLAVGRGWIKADEFEGLAAIGMALGTLAFGLFKTWQAKRQLIVAATAAPDSVARVKE